MAWTGLDTLTAEAYGLVIEKGLPPTEAAAQVVTLDRLSPEEVLYAVQRYVGVLVGEMLTEDRRGEGLTHETRTTARGTVQNIVRPRRKVVSRLVEVMETSMNEAVARLLALYQGVDGVERPLIEFTVEDHQYRARIEASVEASAHVRKEFHLATVLKLEEYKVATINELPLAEQYTLARML